MGSDGKAGHITDGNDNTEHWYMTPTARTEVFRWALEVCSINSPTATVHFWADRASNLMHQHMCPAQALITATVIEFNPRLLLGGGLGSPMRSVAKDTSNSQSESPKRAKIEQDNVCYQFQQRLPGKWSGSSKVGFVSFRVLESFSMNDE